MDSQEDWIEVGIAVAPQGVAGELRVRSLTDFPERLTKKGDRLLRLASKKAEARVQLLSGRAIPGKELFVCRFAQLTDRTAAETWVGATVFVRATERPELATDEYWLMDLIDLPVFRQDTGERIGVVVDIQRAGNDLMVVRLARGTHALIPFVPALVPEVDLAAGRIVVAPLPGLLDQDEPE